MDSVDCVVVGAGVVGLAVARALALVGREVLVLEATNAIGSGISSRNSEVIHAGLYYPTASLKARLCVQGRDLLYDYCAQRGISHSRCGKLVVATRRDHVDQLERIAAQARANGVTDLLHLSGTQAQALEPELDCVAALLSPSTGIVDSHGLMLSLLGDVENAGGILALNSALAHAQCTTRLELHMEDGTRLRANTLVNAAGLEAVVLARRFTGLKPQQLPTAYFAKGNYFSLTGRAPFRHLLYPVPEAGGLGIHLTLDLAGQARFGPDVQWVSSADDCSVDASRIDGFYDGIRRYWPGLPDAALLPGYAGIRPKISGPDAAGADFMIQGPTDHGVPGLVNLFGIESPGLTAALAIGQHVRDLLIEK